MATVTGIELKNLARNDLNPFNESDDLNKIDELVHSIKERGVMQPLVVYPTSNGKFTILLGHRRFEALKRLYESDQKVPCKVIDKPQTQLDEEEFILEGNISRNSDDDVSVLIERANYAWNNMSSGLREKKKNEFENDFKAKYGTRADFEIYKRQNFRPRLEYIKRKTGLSNVTNRTITNQLKKYCSGTSESFISSPKAEREIKFADIKNKAVSLLGLINNIDRTALSQSELDKIEELQKVLERTVV